MKQLFFIALILLAFASCTKDEVSPEEQVPATLAIEVSYFYNDFQGYKPDVAAVAFLCEKDKTTAFYNDSTAGLAVRVGLYTEKSGDWVEIPYKYKGEAGGSGIVNIEGIVPGEYLLLLASEGRYTYTHKYMTIKSGEKISLVKNFNYYSEWEYGGELW